MLPSIRTSFLSQSQVICQGEKTNFDTKEDDFLVKVKVLASQSSQTLKFDSMNCSSPGSYVHGILQARILEWAPIPSPGGTQPRDQIQVSCIAGRFFTTWATSLKLRFSFIPTKIADSCYDQVCMFMSVHVFYACAILL